MQVVWLEDGQLSLRGVDPPEPAEGEARIRVLMAGICNTDLELVAGYYPYRGILGHEFVGVVEIGPDAWAGQRVVGEINVCPSCGPDERNHCDERTVLGIVDRPGAFAELLTLPVENLHRVPDSLSDEAATFVEPLAAAIRITEQLAIDENQRVLVVGHGKLGHLIERVLRTTGCELEVLTRASADPPARSFDVAVDCTGNPDGFERARRALRPRGTLVMKSTYAGKLELDAAPLVVDELTLIGSRCGPFAPALQMLADGTIEVEDLIEATYPLNHGPAAFKHAARPGALKVLIDARLALES